MDKLEYLKETLLKERNLDAANMENEAEESEGYFDAQDYSGGNFDDCYQMGKENGRAELVEELIEFLNKK